ncbi:hypothetical protein AB0K00_20715 [Dactylosporangium sp. NPDC049525]|uniref:hypothetical protein n=1 Tax=Dactylosporangium sp. NPDC049525 TaxID=3154730 RepID=UPI0034256C2C
MTRSAYIAAVVAAAPPLGAEQRATLHALLSAPRNSEAGVATPAIARIPFKDTTDAHATTRQRLAPAA